MLSGHYYDDYGANDHYGDDGNDDKVVWMMILLQETPLEFAGDKQWVVYANQVG